MYPVFSMYQVEVPLVPGLSSLGVPGVPRHTQILADELSLFQPLETDYAHLIATGTPGVLDPPVYLDFFN